MIKRVVTEGPFIFFLMQLFLLISLLVNLNTQQGIIDVLGIIISIIGLFIVAFSTQIISSSKRSKFILFGIFGLSIMTILLVLFFIVIGYISTSMP
ncbi:hypothetical protein [Carnobacterium mobile]|uniref:hypothetical protein n=1 Tax=Carnobacterium mobile TaxID=2750 RepID=UPI001D02186F|nr:hypothetical protein [Carnobacterium mobile]